jgi:hypothetical protein
VVAMAEEKDTRTPKQEKELTRRVHIPRVHIPRVVVVVLLVSLIASGIAVFFAGEALAPLLASGIAVCVAGGDLTIASRAGPYPHACQQFLADGALVLLSRRGERCQGITQTVANQVQLCGEAAAGAP